MRQLRIGGAGGTLEVLLLVVGAVSTQWPPTLLAMVVQGCPARGLIRPCECNEITKGLELLCEGVHLEQLRGIFANVQETKQTIIYLKMKNNQLERFPSMLSSVRVRHLSAHLCNINTIDLDAFEELRHELESIDLSENKISQIPKALKGLTSLVSLNLNFNQISSLGAREFEGLASLLRLSLFGNKIAVIDMHAFVGVGVNLTRINIGGNQLTGMPSTSLRHLTAIQRLQLHENQIETLRAEDFRLLRQIKNLDVLNFARNFLKKLDNFVFSELATINSLDFDSNQIASIEEHAFSGIESSLEWLKLGDNHLEHIPVRALANLTKLRELDLRGNRIRVIRKDSLRPFGRNIKFLYLQKNRIETIEESSFDSLTSLEWIYLNSNQLKQMPESWFGRALKTLWIIDLQDNPLACGCDITWYNRWSEHKTKGNIAKDVHCDMVGTGKPNDSRRSSARVSIRDLSAHLITCGGQQFAAPPPPLLLLSAWPVVMILAILVHN